MPDPHAESLPRDSSPESSPGRKLKLAGYALVALVAVALLVWGGRQAGPYVDRFIGWVEGLGVWAPVAFILGYIVATVAFIPGSILTLAGGALFGLVKGTLYVFIAATVGACLAFLIARYVARSWVEKKIEGNPKFARIDRAIGREGGKIVALLRLSPIFPFNLLNYALGLTKIRFLPYLLACFAMLPGTFLYVYYGKIGRDLATADKTPLDWVFQGVGLAATIAVTWIITKKAQQALSAEVDLETKDE